MSKAIAIRNYDKILIKEWSYQFGEKVDECEGADDATKMSHGRSLFDWSHFNAPQEVRRIDPKYETQTSFEGVYLLSSLDWDQLAGIRITKKCLRPYLTTRKRSRNDDRINRTG